MKKAKLKRSYWSSYQQRQLSLSKDDYEFLIKPTPGEWVIFEYQTEFYIGFANLFAQYPSVYIVYKISHQDALAYEQEAENIVAEKFIKIILHRAIAHRLNYLPYGRHARLVFGSADYMPGVIIDGYENAVMVQINTAGFDRFRSTIQNILETYADFPQVYLLDEHKQRLKESLPQHAKIAFQDSLQVIENKLHLSVTSENWQKNGYYYDHRDNRSRFYQKLTELDFPKDNGLDLFCYLGSWGITALLAGVKRVDFVDQADLETDLSVNLRKNHLEGRGEFHRSDVFSFLDHKIQLNSTYDVVISDPPSFAKSLDKKQQAILGYKKLHRKVLSVVKSGGMVCFASCTHYISLQEFESTIMEAAKLTNKSLTMLDLGLQALDHSFVNFNDKSCYIKYFSYLVE